MESEIGCKRLNLAAKPGISASDKQLMQISIKQKRRRTRTVRLIPARRINLKLWTLLHTKLTSALFKFIEKMTQNNKYVDQGQYNCETVLFKLQSFH